MDKGNFGQRKKLTPVGLIVWGDQKGGNLLLWQRAEKRIPE